MYPFICLISTDSNNDLSQGVDTQFIYLYQTKINGIGMWNNKFNNDR